MLKMATVGQVKRLKMCFQPKIICNKYVFRVGLTDFTSEMKRKKILESKQCLKFEHTWSFENIETMDSNQ